MLRHAINWLENKCEAYLKCLKQPPKHLLKKGSLKESLQKTHDYLQLVDNFLQVVGLNLTGHDLHHLLANLTDLLVLGVRGLSDLVGALLCETNAKQAQKVAIGGLHIHMSFNHCLRDTDQY